MAYMPECRRPTETAVVSSDGWVSIVSSISAWRTREKGLTTSPPRLDHSEAQRPSTVKFD
jgi:hypothetical protein